MPEMQPHVFHEMGETIGTIGLQSLMCQLSHQRHDLGEEYDPGLKASARQDFQDTPGVSSFIPSLPQSNYDEPAISRILFHERFHYWHLISTPSMIAGHLAHIRLIEERVISAGGDSKYLLCVHPCFQRESLVEAAKSNRPILARTMAFMFAQDGALQSFQARYHLTAREWMHLLMYLKWVINETTVEFVEDPSGYFTRLPLDETTRVAMSRDTTLLDVIIRYLPAKHQFVVVPMSATALLESAAYVAECLHCGQLPTFPEEEQMSTGWYIYREPWMTWYKLYGDLYADEKTAAHAFIATIDLMLSTDWLGQAGYFDDADLRDEMLSQAYRFTAHLRTHRFVRSKLQDSTVLRSGNINWAEYQNELAHIMGWPKPQKIVRRLFEYFVVLDAIIYAFSGKMDINEVYKFADPNLPETTDDALFKLYEQLVQIRTAVGGSAPVLGQRLLETSMHALYYRYTQPGIWADPVSNHEMLQQLFGLPVIWVNDSPFSEGVGQPVIDLMRYISIHGLSALSGIDKDSLHYLFDLLKQGDPAMRLDFDSERNPMRCGIEQFNIPCDHMAVGFTCPFRAEMGDRNVATRCYYVDTLQRFKLQSSLPVIPNTSDPGSPSKQPKKEKMNFFRKLFRKKPKTGYITQIGGAVFLTDEDGRNQFKALEEFARRETQKTEKVQKTKLACPYCGEKMQPSLSGLSLQCGERSVHLHPVIMWDPRDGLYSTFDAEIASMLQAKGFQVEKTGRFFNLKPPTR